MILNEKFTKNMNKLVKLRSKELQLICRSYRILFIKQPHRQKDYIEQKSIVIKVSLIRNLNSLLI